MRSPGLSVHYDVMVVGGGIAGMQAALDLADQGFKVVIVERDSSIGGKMIRLDKVFPTLDCASCITTPKMASVAHHKNIDICTLCEVDSIKSTGDYYAVEIIRNPRYVKESDCIGCRQCESVCPMMSPDDEQLGLTARKAIYIPFSNAIPQVARLELEDCILCGRCRKQCPTGAIDYFQEPEKRRLEAKAIIFATGYRLLEEYPQRAFGDASKHPNIIDALQLERILSPTGPYMHLLRPGDGKEPKSIAFLKCAGSRDKTLGVGYCSRVCCMYTIKNALLIKQELPEAEVTIFYIDIRAFGKNYEQFFRNAQENGINFIKAKPVILGEGKGQGVIIRYEDQEGTGGPVQKEYDMVVLSLALIPAWNPRELIDISIGDDGFIASAQPKIAPALTSMEGIFIAGVTAGPKDIVDTIMEAGAAAMEAANYLKHLEKKQVIAA